MRGGGQGRLQACLALDRPPPTPRGLLPVLPRSPPPVRQSVGSRLETAEEDGGRALFRSLSGGALRRANSRSAGRGGGGGGDAAGGGQEALGQYSPVLKPVAL
mmetsp:Transcript_45338/g.78199  ORF Transcript_45338/g.78199 Transcript_45338/m.78199 type:complete len:103 (+) Transcript_45338:1276-1584(+)